MNKAQIQYEKCKRVAKDNTKCLSILLKIVDKDREDIIDQIADINKLQYDVITPAGIVALYNRCNEDIDILIAAYDKQMDNAQYIRNNFYDGYEKGVQDYINGK